MSKTEWIYGVHSVLNVLKVHPQTVLQICYAREGQSAASDIEQLAKQYGIAFHVVSKSTLNKHVGEVNHQGVAIECKGLPSYQEQDILPLLEQIEGGALILILDGIQDPHNLGACLRTANAMGVHMVIAPKDRACAITPIVRKVASGAAELTPFIMVSNLARTLKMLQAQGIWLVGLSLEAPAILSSIDLCGNIGLVMGAEGEGLRHLTEKHCDYLAKITLPGAVESLNVSVATGMALYEVLRQRL